MSRALILLLCAASLRAASLPTVVNGARHVSEMTSFDIDNFTMSDVLATYFDNFQSGRTNGWVPISRSAGSLQELNEGDGSNGPRIHKLALPWLANHTNSIQTFVWVMHTGNGGYNDVTVRTHLTNVVRFATNLYNGSAYAASTGWGATSGVPNFIIISPIPADSDSGLTTYGGGDGTVAFGHDFGFPTVDLRAPLWIGDSNGTSGWGWDRTNGTRLAFGGNLSSHPNVAGQLNADYEIIKQTGLETNIALATLDWSAGTVVSTSRVAISSAVRSGNTLSFVWRSDGMPPSYDIPGVVITEGTITNDARPAFTLIPSHGNLLRFGISLTNLTPGTYTLKDGAVTLWSGPHTQLASFLNLATNDTVTAPFVLQMAEVLRLHRLLRGIHPVCMTNLHDAGTSGTYGVDLINYLSNAEDRWDAGKRDDDIIGSLTAWTDSIRTNYISRIAAAAIQTNHTFTLTYNGAIIGTECAVTTPTSANFKLWGGNFPADGKQVQLNPPVFGWTYAEDPMTMGYPNALVRNFYLQTSTNSAFATTNLSVLTSNNYFNFLGPFTNHGASVTQYWRIVYANSNAASIVATSAVHHFTFTNGVVTWNRAPLGDSNYVASIAANHPHLFYTATNRHLVRQFLKTNTLLGWSYLSRSNSAYQMVTNFPDMLANPSFAESNIAVIAGAALMRDLDTNSTFDSSAAMGSAIATNWIIRGKDRVDQNTMSGAAKWLPVIYDLTYSYASDAQRSNMLYAIECFAKFFVYEEWWYVGTAADTNRNYAGPYVCDYSSAAKTASSHARVDLGIGCYMALAGYAESAALRECWQYFGNAAIARPDPYNCDEGFGYAEQSFRTLHNFSAQILMDCMFRELAMTNHPWFPKYTRMLATWEPLLYVENQSLWGDFPFNAATTGESVIQLYQDKYITLAYMLQNGAMLRHYNRSFTVRSGTADFYPYIGDAFWPYYYQTPPTDSDWSLTDYFDPEDGWLMWGSKPANDWGAFTNGTRIITRAAPQSGRYDHGTMNDGNVDWSAWGAKIFCGGIGKFYKHPDFGNGLFVRGIGNNTPAGLNETESRYAYFLQKTNAGPWVYWNSEIGPSLSRSNIAVTGGDGNQTGTYYANNHRPEIVSVKRAGLAIETNGVSLLFLFDQFQTAVGSNCNFQIKQNIMETNSLVVNTSGCSWTYTATNFFIGSNVTVRAALITDPATLLLTNMLGQAQSKTNPFTAQAFSSIADTSNDYRDTLWVQNATANTNQTFFHCYAAEHWTNTTATVFTRKDDYTVAVTNTAASLGFVVTWSTNYAGEFNYMLDTSSTLAASSDGGGPTGVQAVTLRGVTIGNGVRVQ